MSEQTSWESPAISDAIGDLDSAARRLVSLGLDDDAAKDWFAESLFRAHLDSDEDEGDAE